MDNKETLQQHNARLNENNVEMNDILEAVNNLPRIDDVLALQDKTVDPTTETQIIEADVEYHGLRTVTVNAMITPKFAPKHISFYKSLQSNLDDDLANVDLSNVTYAGYMFDNNSSLKSIKWTNQNAPNLTSVGYFASNNRNVLKTVDLSDWYVPELTTMNNMFYYDQYLTNVILKGWETPKLSNVSGVFSNCNRLAFVDIRDMTFDNVSNYSNMFSSSYHTNTEIIVKGETEKAWLLERFSFLTGVKTLAEYEAEL